MKYIIFTLLILPFGCGKSETKSQIKNTLVDPIVSEEINGIYRADLYPINPIIDGGLVGSSTVARDRDEFVIDVTISLAAPNVFHPQNIHTGKRCPTIADDLNGDGFIDIEEALKVVGDTLIPIDEDISSQWMGYGTYPMTDEFGSFFWAKATSFSKLLADLYEKDINFDDGITKLKPNTPLSFDGKVVMILGVSLSEELPNTVIGRKRMGPHAALPLACGLYQKVIGAPGRIDQDDSIKYPLPFTE